MTKTTKQDDGEDEDEDECEDKDEDCNDECEDIDEDGDQDGDFDEGFDQENGEVDDDSVELTDLRVSQAPSWFTWFEVCDQVRVQIQAVEDLCRHPDEFSNSIRAKLVAVEWNINV